MIRHLCWRARKRFDTLALNWRWRRHQHVLENDGAERDYLWHMYRTYTTHISSNIMAISWQLSLFLVDALSTQLFTSCVDLGSGFSSYLIRYWRHRIGGKWQVTSVDDSVVWLDKTKHFISQQGLPTDQLYTTNEFLDRIRSLKADFILYDYSDFAARAQFLPSVTNLLTPRTIIVFDDYQFRGDTAKYKQAVDEWCFRNHMGIVYLAEQTLDEHGRFAVLSHPLNHSVFWRFLRRLT